MIRLRPRVGIFRVLSVLVLISGLVGGLLISDRKSQRRTTASTLAAQAADVSPVVVDQNQKDAQTKANDAATAAAAQANAANDQARKQEPASRPDRPSPSGSPSPSGGSAGPIPPDCKVYSGNRAIGCTVMLQSGYGIDQAPCLVSLFNKESGWNERARNPNSGAYGIPQALPGEKMAVFGADWRTNPVTQIKWGLSYIKSRYQTPCGAWGYMQRTGWY